MHLCICASFSNGVMVSLGMFTLDLQTSLGRRKFPHWQERLDAAVTSRAA